MTFPVMMNLKRNQSLKVCMTIVTSSIDQRLLANNNNIQLLEEKNNDILPEERFYNQALLQQIPKYMPLFKSGYSLKPDMIFGYDL